MTDRSDLLDRYRLPLSREQLKPAAALAVPAMRFARRNPLMLIGALALGVAGALAWRNREKIAQTAGPLIDDARTRGQALVEDAKVKGHDLIEKGHDLIDEARTATEAVVEKAASLRRRATGKSPQIDVY